MSTLQELFNKAKGVQETSLWDLCAAAGYTEDRLYKPGEISRREDGSRSVAVVEREGLIETIEPEPERPTFHNSVIEPIIE